MCVQGMTAAKIAVAGVERRVSSGKFILYLEELCVRKLLATE